MAFTYSRLASTTVGVGGASTISFSNIPQNYTDLVVKASVRDTGAVSVGSGYSFSMGFNSVTTNLTYRSLYAYNAAGPLSGTNTQIYAFSDAGNDTVNTFTNTEFYIPNYTSSNFKSVSVDDTAENNTTYAGLRIGAGLWSNVTTITSIQLYPAYANFAQYSTATLYGVRVEL
jgi:hypothetical protein